MTQVFLLPGTTTFPDPGNWNPSSNLVECVGSGGIGGTGFMDPTSVAGGGGGGGGYAWQQNIVPTFPVPCNIPTTGGTGASTNFGTTSPGFTQTPGVISAGGGLGGFTAGGGSGSGGSFYPNGFAGGPGGGGSGSAGGGGGGAAGPSAAGAAGVVQAGGGVGGAANGGSAAGGAPGGAGASTPIAAWGNLYGPGSGGGGATSTTVGGGVGGNYGGGGGGGWMANTGTGRNGGAGGGGIIVITYTPPTPVTRIFVHPNVATFPDPGNWNPGENKVECLGLGGYGGFGIENDFSASGAGGGGGGYAYDVNLNPTFPVSISVPSYQQSAPVSPFSYCRWNGWANSPGNVWAGFGYFGQATAQGAFSYGGAGGTGYPNGLIGGTGGNGGSETQPPFGNASGGGGGAAGPDGAGGNGVAAAGSVSGAGGTGDGGNVPGGAVDAPGVSGTQWDASHGVGSGGGGGSATGLIGQNGGTYGGGGGGGFGQNNAGGVAGSALMVVTYVPKLPPDATVIFLHPNVSRFPDPGNWNPASNKVECVGAGGVGSQMIGGSFSPQGTGGGGGGYAWDENLDPTFPVPTNIQAISIDVSTNPPHNTFWNGSANTPGNVIGGNGLISPTIGGPSQVGGAGGGGYPNFTTGGRGGTSSEIVAAGAGGAAGPLGNGGDGTTTTGGSADGGGTPGTTTPGQNGINGTQWDASHGLGSGGAPGNSTTTLGGDGGLYGGGGGGTFNQQATPPRHSPGLIVVTYVALPSKPVTEGQVQIMA